MPHTILQTSAHDPCAKPPGKPGVCPDNLWIPPFESVGPMPGCEWYQHDSFDRTSAFPLNGRYHLESWESPKTWNLWNQEARLVAHPGTHVTAAFLSKKPMCLHDMHTRAIVHTNAEYAGDLGFVYACPLARVSVQPFENALAAVVNMLGSGAPGADLRISAFIAGAWQDLVSIPLPYEVLNDKHWGIGIFVQDVPAGVDSYIRVNGQCYLQAICPPELKGFQHYGFLGQIGSGQVNQARDSVRFLGCIV